MECKFWPAIVVTSNPIINFINVHSLHQQHTACKMRIDKVKWIMLTTVASRNDIHSSLV